MGERLNLQKTVGIPFIQIFDRCSLFQPFSSAETDAQTSVIIGSLTIYLRYMSLIYMLETHETLKSHDISIR